MKKRTKLMLVLLSSAMVAASAAGIAGCKKDKTPTVDETYKSYVAYAEANNQEVLSYDEWIQAILGASKPGPEGPTGPQGPQGPQGEAAEPIGIESVEIRDGKLVLIFTDGSEKEAELPDQITHVHTYDEKNVNVLIPVTEDSDGLGYIVCKDEGCGHVEVVVMKRSYDITVKMGGQPVAGIDVVINGTTATTDANGVAQIMNFGEFNDYLVSIGTPGYSTAQLYRTGLRFGVAMEIEINKSFVDAREVKGESNIDYFVEIDGAGDYVVDLETADSYDELVVTNKELRLYGGETEAKYYKISSASPYFSIENGSGAEIVVEGEAIFALQPGETQKVYLAANKLALSQAQHTSGENAMYTVKVEEIEAPTAGSVWNPVIVAANEFMTLPATDNAGGWVYYKWTNLASDIGNITITIEGAEVEFTTKTYNADYGETGLADATAATNIVSDQQFDIVVPFHTVTATDPDLRQLEEAKREYDAIMLTTYYSAAPYTIRARATGSGEHKFKLNAVYNKGSLADPETLTLDNSDPTHFDGTENTVVWAKVEVPATGLYAVTGCTHKLSVGFPESENPVTLTEYDAEATAIYELTQGEDYYIRLKGYDGVNVMFRNINPALDAGKSASLPIALTGDNVPVFTGGIGAIAFDPETYGYEKSVYFSFTAPEDGTLTVDGGYDWDESVIYIGDGTTQKEYKEGDTIVVSLKYSGWDSVVNMPLYWTTKPTGNTGEGPDPENPDNPPAPQAAEHTFTVVDDNNNPVSGVVVTVNGVSSAATDADGVAKLSVVPGKYAIGLSGYDTDTYYYGTTVDTSEGRTSGYKIVLRTDKQTFNFALKCNDQALNISGATLKVMDGKTVLASTTVTNGTASVSFFFPSREKLSYELELTEEQKQNYSKSNDTVFEFAKTEDQAPIEINLVGCVNYIVSIVNENGRAVSGVGVQLSYGSNVVTSGTTDANGTVTVKATPLSEYETYTVSFTDIPSGYRIANGQFNETTQSIEVVMLEGDNEATGSEWLNYNYLESQSTLTTGNNVINNPQAESGYKFTASAPGRYTFAVRNADNTSYICYLGVMQGYNQKDYIRNGKQIYSAKNLVLGAKRDYNQTYELSIDLTAGDIVIIGYHTGTEEGGNGNIIVTADIAPGTTAIHRGNNTVNLVDGSAYAYFSHDFYMEYSNGYEITFEWEGDVTVTIDGEVCESGETIDGFDGGVVELVITSSTAASVTVTVTVTGNSGYGGYGY